MKVDILTIRGCPNVQATREVVEAVLDDEGLTAEVSVVEVGDEGTAQALRFLGSPTVQVNGVDAEPARRGDAPTGLTCRLYRYDAGGTGTPPKALVRAAVLEAHMRGGRP